MVPKSDAAAGENRGIYFTQSNCHAISIGGRGLVIDVEIASGIRKVLLFVPLRGEISHNTVLGFHVSSPVRDNNIFGGGGLEHLFRV